MLFEELKKLEESVLKDGVDTQRFYEVCEAYFIAKFIDGVCLSDKETINKMLTDLNVAQYILSNGVLEDDLKQEFGLDSK